MSKVRSNNTMIAELIYEAMPKHFDTMCTLQLFVLFMFPICFCFGGAREQNMCPLGHPGLPKDTESHSK